MTDYFVDFVSLIFVGIGVFFLLVGTVGLYRLPDLYNRMHATSKATTMGACSIFVAAFIHFGADPSGFKAAIGALFLLLTAPAAAHMIARAAHRTDVPFAGRDVRWPAPDEPIPAADPDDDEAGAPADAPAAPE